MLHRERLRPPSHDYPADEWNVVEKAFHPELLAQLETMLALGNGTSAYGGARRRAAQTLKTVLSLMGSMKRGPSSRRSGVLGLLIKIGEVQLPYLDLTKGTLPLPGCLPKMDDGNLKYQPARSFDAALSQFIASEGSEADTAENRGRLAARLVVLSKLGETDEHQLASNAALYLLAFAGAMRIASGAKRAQAEAVLTSHIALGPDAIDAMVEALHRCLDELPQGGASSTARDVLQKAILEAAGHGERNADKLQAFALEKLRTRS